MTYRTNCPYCGSEHLECHEGDKEYYCLGCGNFFTEDEAQFEDIRHELSALVMDTTEKHPLECYIPIDTAESQGLSTLELPTIVAIFQDCEGIIWFKMEGCAEPMEFDDLTLEEVKNILIEVKNLKIC